MTCVDFYINPFKGVDHLFRLDPTHLRSLACKFAL